MPDKPKIRERIITILSEAGVPLDFEAIYAALEADGYGLPAEKPKLKIRRILFDTETFTAEKGEYVPATAAAEAGEAPVAEAAAPEDSDDVVIPKLVNAPEPPAQVVEALESLTPPPPEAAPVVPVAEAAPAAPQVKWGLRQRIMTLLAGQEEGLTFNQVYAALEQDGFHMPVDKPKLKVRKILYDTEMFTTRGKGMFVLIEGISPPGPAPAPPPPGSQPAPAPAPKKKPTAARPGKPQAATRRPSGKPGASRKPAAKPAPTGPKRPLRDRMITAMNAAGKPLTFEEVYAALEQDGFAMPADKPKLKVRKVLFDKATFASAGKGLYEVQSGVEAAPAPAAAPPPAAATLPAPVMAIDPATFANDPEVKAAAQQAAKEAAEEGRKAAAEAAKAAAAAAREAAIEAAKAAAVEQAKKAAIEAAKKAAVEQAREMATKAAREAAAEAAQEAAKAAQEAAAEAAKAVTAEAVEAARKAAQEAAKQASSEIPPQAPPAATPPPAVPAAPAAPETVNSATADQEAQQGSRRSGKGSLRERAATAIFEADKPLTGDEVFAALSKDGFPLPRNNPREVLQKVLDNRDLFALSDDGKYVPMVEA